MSNDQENFLDLPEQEQEQDQNQAQQQDQPEEQGLNVKAQQEKKYQLKDMDLTSIFVNNLEENTTEEDLREYFKDCGKIEKITLRNDKLTGMMFSYLQFTEPAAVEDALLLSDGMIRGKKIKVFQKRTNLRSFGRRTTRGRPMRMTFRGRYSYNAPSRGRGSTRGAYNKFSGA